MPKPNQNTETQTAEDPNVNTAGAEGATGAEGQPAAVAEDNTNDERFRWVKHDKTGAMVKRKDFILECWKDRKMARGPIA
jgi:hypothetical protein